MQRLFSNKGSLLRKAGLLGAFLFIVGLTSFAPTHAAINKQVNFQGRLTDANGNVVADGNYNIEFKLYTSSASDAGQGTCTGTCVWRETRLNSASQGVAVSRGLFSVQLGEVTSIASVNFNQDLYLAARIGGLGNPTPTWESSGGVGGSGEMGPRHRLGAAPTAIFADNAGQLNGNTAGNASGNIAINNGTVNTNLNADMVDGFHAGNASGNVAVSNGTVNTNLNADLLDGQTGSFYQDAGNINAGTLTDNRLTSNVALLARTGQVFTGDNTIRVTAAAALSVQKAASADTILTADTTNNKVVIGNGAASAAGDTTMLVVDTVPNGIALPTGANGAILYDANTGVNKFKIYENGAWKILCNTTDAGCGSGGTTTLQTAYAAASGNTIATTDARDVAITLTNTTTDANFTINAACSVGVDCSASGGRFAVQTGATDTFSVLPGGAALHKTTTNTATAFQIQNSAGNSLFRADTASFNTNNLLANASLEGGANPPASWAAKGSATVTSDAAQNPPYGRNGGKVVTTGVNQGIQQNVTVTVSTVYSISFYARLDSASAALTNLVAGYNNGTTDTDCTLNTSTVISNGWTKYICSVTTPSTGTAGTFYVKDVAGTHTFYVDAATLETDANASGAYSEGDIFLNGAIASPLILQNTANSTTAFQVQNASGYNIFTVDTTDTNLIGNPGFETNTTGWAKKGAAAVTATRDTSQYKFGVASMKIGTTALANDGAAYTFPTALPVGTYTLAFSAKLSSGAFGAGTMTAGITNGGGDNVCTLSPAVSATVPNTTGWSKFTCSVTIATTSGTAFFVKQTDAVARSFWIDSIELDAGATASPYGLGALSLNGVINSPLTLKGTSDNNEAMVIYQPSTNNPIFTVDTHSGADPIGIEVGSPTTDASAVLLTFDSYNNATDPTGQNGAMYYNSATNSFRCYVNGAWQSCGPQTKKVSGSDVTVANTTAVDVTGLTFGVAANTDYSLSCNLVYTAAATTTGIRLGLNGPATPTMVAGQFTTSNVTAATNTVTALGGWFNAYGAATGTAAVGAATTNTPAHLEATFRNGANAGTLAVRVASSAVSNVVVKIGSSCALTQL